MVSFVYITDRPLLAFLAPELRGATQYDVLAASLSKQRGDYELIVVDKHNVLPRPELAALGSRVRYARPCWSPWALATTVARDTGLNLASGDAVVGLDDCASFDGGLLEAVERHAALGEFLVPATVAPDVPPPVLDGPRVLCGGILAYPRALAIELGGHEYRMAGGDAYDDWEFSRRLTRAGVRFVYDRGTVVRLHQHVSVVRPVARCAHLVYWLLRESRKANQPWTAEQLAGLSGACPFRRDGCELIHAECDCAVRPTAEAVRAMREYEYLPQTDLRCVRPANVVA